MVKKKKRKILFRGKCKATNLWYYGFLYKGCFILGGDEDFMHGEYRDTIDKTWIDDYMYCVDPETVGQFTGLCDRNGKEIFEGDIVSVYSDCDGYYTEEQNLRGVVMFDDEDFFDYEVSFNHIRNTCLEYLSNHRDNIEVIGNIYDNPKMLEVE